jgi:flagellar motor switch/type III secretory pathway protein FliN
MNEISARAVASGSVTRSQMLTKWTARSVASDEALLRTAVGRGRRMEFDIDGQSVKIEVVPTHTATLTPQTHSLIVGTDVGCLRIQPCASFLQVLTGIDLPKDDLDSPMSTLLLEATFQRLPIGWKKAFGVRSTEISSTLNKLSGVDVRLLSSTTAILWSGTLSGATPALVSFLASGAWQGGNDDPYGVERCFSVDWPVSIGSSRLLGRELRELARGDLVPVQSPLIDKSGVGRVDGPTFSMICQLSLGAKREIEFLGWKAKMQNEIEEPLVTDIHTENDEPNVPWDELPLSLSFDVGTLSLTLAELKALSPGAVLQVGRAREATVTLRCAGRIVGLGELVEVNDMLAVEVVQIGHHR